MGSMSETAVPTDAELIRSYQNAFARADAYSGNNPGRQVALDRQARELASKLRERGLNPANYEQEALEHGVRP
jgi:hypothetical protein